MTCRTCTHLIVLPNAAGKRIPRKNKTYMCSAPIPAPVLPASVTKSHGWHWPPSRSHMEPDDGEGCPLWRIKTAAKTPAGQREVGS